MKFIVSSNALLKQLQVINGVISSNTVLPILEDFLFDIDKNRLTILASDLETLMKVHLDIEAKEAGRVCIPAKILVDTLKNLPDQPLTINVDANYGIEITSDNGKYKIMGENPDSFPKESTPDETGHFEISSSAFLNMISKAIIAVSNDDLRPAMTGVFFELDPKGLTAVATDAHRLVKIRRKDASCPKNDSFVVPKKPLNLLKNTLPDTSETLQVSYNDKQLFVNHPNIQLVCRLIDARFPDYRVVIPEQNPYLMTVNRTEFQSALRRVSVYSNKSTNQVALSITGSELQLTAQDVDFSFEGNERMTCRYDGEDLQIAFNAKFLVDLLGCSSSEEVRLELSSPSRAGIVRPVEEEPDEELLMLVMPLMLNA
jgi:DNA polymerase-3 subunit beta